MVATMPSSIVVAVAASFPSVLVDGAERGPGAGDARSFWQQCVELCSTVVLVCETGCAMCSLVVVGHSPEWSCTLWGLVTGQEKQYVNMITTATVNVTKTQQCRNSNIYCREDVLSTVLASSSLAAFGSSLVAVASVHSCCSV